MSQYYSGQRAQSYNTRWHTFTQKTLEEVTALLDMATLHHLYQQAQPLRILDVACGTGVLLQYLLSQFPDAQVFGVDASADMLKQAQSALKGYPFVDLQQATVGTGATSLPHYPPHSFALITCTNALHDIPEPVATLTTLKQLLAPQGQLVVEDYARREPPFPWFMFEWLIRRIERGHVQAYTLAEAHALGIQAGLSIAAKHTFSVDWLWHGWVLRMEEKEERS